MEKFINYGHYGGYRMTSTIQLSKETKDLISTFGIKGDTFEAIIKRLYGLAVQEQLRQFLMSSENCVPVKDALKRAKEKWSK